MHGQMTVYISLERSMASTMRSISYLTRTELVNEKLKFSLTLNFPDLVASRKAILGNTWK